MKELRGSAGATVTASIEQCFALLVEVEEYPAWYPEVVRAVRVRNRSADGRASRVDATLRVSRGPLVRDLELTLGVQPDPPGAITLIRLPNEPGDPEEFEVRWRLEVTAPGTRIGVELEARLDVPRMLPLGGIGDALAGGFLAAAARAVSRTP